MGQPRILIIDDEDHIREIVKIALEVVAGYEVVGTGSAQQGLELADKMQPDAILLDVKLPILDGPSVFAALEANPRTAGIPVVWLTASVQGHERRRIENLGGNGLVSKPFNPVTLANTLCERLGWPAPAERELIA
jgi:CheY-like chemotaxis protein